MNQPMVDPTAPTSTQEKSDSRQRWFLGGLAVVAAMGIGAGVALTQGDDAGTDPSSSTTTEPDELAVADPADDDAGDDGQVEPDDSDDGQVEPDDSDSTNDSDSTEVHHIFANNTLVGSWTGSSWSSQFATATELDGLVATGAFGQAIVGLEPADVCYGPDGELAWMSVGAEMPGLAATGIDGQFLAISGTSIAPAQAHIDVVATQLQAAGLPDAPVEITEVLRLDLEGDGVDEVLITAARGEPHFYGSRIGDYSMAILRRVTPNDDVENIVLGFSATTGNEPGLEAAEDLYGDEGTEGIYLQAVWTWTIASLVDLNGDGVVEIGLERTAYESWGMEVFDTTSGDVAVPVLSSSCGV